MVKKALIYTYSIQIYSALSSIIFVPFYLKLFTIEEYGLISFFFLIQSIMMIFDVGIGGTVSRTVAITKNNFFEFVSFYKKFIILLIFFLLISLSIFVSSMIFNNLIIQKWLISSLENSILKLSVISIFAIVALRYITNPLRSFLIGLEEHVLISKINFLFVTAKFPLGLLVLFIYDNSITTYFLYQVLISLIELIVFFTFFKLKSSIIVSTASKNKDFNKISLKSLFLFSVQLSILTVTWIIVSQIDKLILSGILPLEQFSYYSLAVTVTSIILLFSAPISQILMSRLSLLYKKNDFDNYKILYINSFSISSVIIVSLGLFIFFFSKEIIYIWTGNIIIANESFIFTKWLSLGNSMSILLTFIFLLQYSQGKLKIHTTVYVIYSLILIPITIYIAKKYLGYGSALFWFIHNFLFFIFWGNIVHNKYFNTVNKFIWIYLLTPIVILSSTYFATIASYVDLFEYNRWVITFSLILIGSTNLIILFIYYKFFEIKIKNSITNIELKKENND